MRQVTTYVSDDGMEFATREECEKHETSITEFPPCIIAFDESGERIEDPNEWDNVEYLIIKDNAEEALEFMNSYYGAFERDMKPGRWYYDWADDKWANFDSLSDKVSRMKEIFDRYDGNG